MFLLCLLLFLCCRISDVVFVFLVYGGCGVFLVSLAMSALLLFFKAMVGVVYLMLFLRVCGVLCCVFCECFSRAGVVCSPQSVFTSVVS